MIQTFTQLLHQKTKQKGMKTATIVADVLCISQDAAYRRIRNPESFLLHLQKDSLQEEQRWLSK